MYMLFHTHSCSSKSALDSISILIVPADSYSKPLYIYFLFSEFLPIPDTWTFPFDATSLLTLAYRDLLAKRRIY